MPVRFGETEGAGGKKPYRLPVPEGRPPGPIRRAPSPAVDNFSCDVGTAGLAIGKHPTVALNALLAQGYRMGYNGGVRCDSVPGFTSCRGELHQGPNLTPVPTTLPRLADGRVDKKFLQLQIKAQVPRPRGRSLSWS